MSEYEAATLAFRTAEQDQRHAAADERRHTEAMRALEALIARTAPDAAGERT